MANEPTLQQLIVSLLELDQDHLLGASPSSAESDILARRQTLVSQLGCICQLDPTAASLYLAELQALGLRTEVIQAQIAKEREDWLHSLEEAEAHLRQLVSFRKPEASAEASLLDRIA